MSRREELARARRIVLDSHPDEFWAAYHLSSELNGGVDQYDLRASSYDEEEGAQGEQSYGRSGLVQAVDEFNFEDMDGFVQSGHQYRVLEPSCGTATRAIRYVEFVQSLGASVDVVCLDSEERMLAEAQSNITKRGFEDISVENGSMTDLSMYGSDSFDMIWNVFTGLSHIDRDDFLPTLQEIRRVLRPGGKMYIDLNIRDKEDDNYMEKVTEDDIANWRFCLHHRLDWKGHVGKYGSCYFFGQEEAIDLFEQAGFTVEKIKEIDNKYTPTITYVLV